MKRSSSVKLVLGAAVVASGLAASVPAFAAPYITIDILARPADVNASRYTVANGSGGYVSLSGYSPTVGTNNDTTGYTASITPSAGQSFEYLIRVTLAPEGTTNPFATGNTTIINWNSSTVNASTNPNPTGISSLKFNMTQSTSGTQVNAIAPNQGPGFDPDPNGDGSAGPGLDYEAVMDRITDQTNTSTARWDRGTGYSGGILTNRGNGFHDVDSVLLVRPGGNYTGLGGTADAPTISPSNAAIGYFTVGTIGASSTFGMDFNLVSSSLFAGALVWRNAADTADITYSITQADEAASIAGNDPIIKVNPLTIVGVGPSPANLVLTPVNGTPRTVADTVTIANTAAGGSDSLTVSGVSITPILANGVFSQSGIAAGTIAAGANQIGTLSLVAGSTNGKLNGAKITATLDFNVVGTSLPATGATQGNQSYPLSAVVSGITTGTGIGTPTARVFSGVPQTAVVASGDTLAGLNSTEAGSLQNKLNFVFSSPLNTAGSASVDWRMRSDRETFPTGTNPPLPGGINGLISDVAQVGLTGLPSTGATVTIEISYDPALLNGASETVALLANRLYLARMHDDPSDGFGQANDTWSNAGIAVNDGINGGINGTPDGVLGHWGVDLSGPTHYAWAVVDPASITSNDNQFAVVPEPASLGLLALGALGLIRRRK